MVLALSPGLSEPRTGLRQIDLRRDLRPIADLISEAFAGELDAAGRASLQDMRMLARLGPFLHIFVPPGGELGGFFRGFVWESDGNIVGNVTIQQADPYGKRWMIANVAVQHNYRGQGIARALVDAALNRIRQLGGTWALLQVREDNDIALGLYERLGFSRVVTETQLRCFQVPPVPAPLLPSAKTPVPLYPEDQEAIDYLVSQSVPQLARWWHSKRNKGFRKNSDSLLLRRWGHLIGQGHRLRLGFHQGTDLVGILDIDSNPRAAHQIDILLHPDLRQSWTVPLLDYGLHQLGRHPGQPVNALLYDYQPAAIARLREHGFHTTSSLITMRKRIQSLAERHT